MKDFSSGFDLLLNSYAIPTSFGSTDNPGTVELDEFEKSQFLTKAQEAYVLGLYTGKNAYGESFEQTEEMRRYLAPLVKWATLSPITTTSGMPLGVDSKSKFFTLPEDLWFITYESVHISDGQCAEVSDMEVVPVTQDEYHKLKKNPFRGPNDRRSLRLDLSEGVIEIVSKHTVESYYLRYLKKLKPIILVDLGEDASIEGYHTHQPCELHEGLHQKILELAVQMALQSKGYKLNSENN